MTTAAADTIAAEMIASGKSYRSAMYAEAADMITDICDDACEDLRICGDIEGIRNLVDAQIKAVLALIERIDSGRSIEYSALKIGAEEASTKIAEDNMSCVLSLMAATPTALDAAPARKREHAERVAQLLEEPCDEIDLDEVYLI